MTVFTTTKEEIVQLAVIAANMKAAGLEDAFIADAMELAKEDQGAFDLMALWDEETDEADRDETVADLQEIIDTVKTRPRAPEEKPYIPFDGLDDVAKEVRLHKKRLRLLIDKHGGVTAVAKKAKMPQPSLSRMLNSAAMPRRTTLYRIANALGVPEDEVVGEWVQ